MATSTFDFETLSSYTLEVTAFDGVLQDVNNLTVYIDDVNEEPFFTAADYLGDVLENETAVRVVVNMDASDPDGDPLTYTLPASYPSGAPFTVDSLNGTVRSKQ